MNNLFDKTKNAKKIGLIIVAVAVIAVLLLNVKIQSVSNHEKEQQSIVGAYITDIGKDGTGAVISGTKGASDNGGQNADNSFSGNRASAGQDVTGTATGSENGKNNTDAGAAGIQNGSTMTDPDTNSAGGTSIGNTTSENGSTGDGTAGNAATESANTGSTVQEPGTQAAPAENEISYVTCTITIKCDELSNSMGSWTNSTKNAALLVPSNGYLVDTLAISIKSGSSVLDVLKFVTKARNIAMVTALNSDYVKSIGQIAEKDAGAQSGWMYSVNSAYPDRGCSSYIVQSNDVIVWNYSLHE